MFVDTEGDTSEATWIGKLAVIPYNTDASNIVVFDSVNQGVEIIGGGNLKAAIIKKIVFSENGTVKFTQTVQKQSGNPVIHVLYTKPQAKFDVTFYKNHINVDWRMNYDEFHDCHGWINGQVNFKRHHWNASRYRYTLRLGSIVYTLLLLQALIVSSQDSHKLYMFVLTDIIKLEHGGGMLLID